MEFKIHTKGVEIFGFNTEPETIKGVVVLVHGFGEHSGRYVSQVIPMIHNSGLAVFTYDNIGHGKSEGKRGDCHSYNSLLDILEAVIAKAETQYPKLPVFLYGHSMGGNLVLNYVLRRESNISGVIATSPYLRLAFQPPKWKMILGKLMLHLLPSITLPSGLDAKGISRIPAEVEKYKNDPLVHDQVSPMFSFPIIDAGEWAISNAEQLKINTLLLHGDEDPIIDYNGSIQFHKNANTTSLKIFEGGYHELHNDLCKEEILEVISAWLKQQFV